MADSACVRLKGGEEILAFSRAMIEGGSKSFARAATLMPPDIRDSVYMLYAWCRHCDDCIDDQVRDDCAVGVTPDDFLVNDFFDHHDDVFRRKGGFLLHPQQPPQLGVTLMVTSLSVDDGDVRV